MKHNRSIAGAAARGLLYALVVWLAGGCASSGRSIEQHRAAADDKVPMVPHYQSPPPAATEGSLWQDNSTLSDMYGDLKARHVGDIVTVNIVETSSASNNASTNTGRDSSVSGGVDNFFNLENKISTSGFNPFAALKAGLANDFEGEGTTSRSGSLNAYITARVMALLPNGNLQIAGSREITVNNETQLIVLTGVIRPKDISSANIIESTYIADAKIAYSGSGIIDQSQQPGWMSKILNSIWPF